MWASAWGLIAGILGFLVTNPLLVLLPFLPDRAPGTAWEEASAWALLAGGAVTYALLPWALRAASWDAPLPDEAPWPRAAFAAPGLTAAVCLLLLARAHAALDRAEPLQLRARWALVALIAVALAGLVLTAWLVRTILPWGALATAGVACLLAMGPVLFYALTYAEGADGLMLYFFGAPSLALLAVQLRMLAKLGGPVRRRRLALGLATGVTVAVVAVAAFLLADLDGQAAKASEAHEEAPGLAWIAAVAGLLAAAAAGRRR